MKKYLSTLIFSLVFVWGNAQQRPQFTQYVNNVYIQNPAVTGAYDYIDLNLGYRNQWEGFEDAPKTVFLSGHTPLGGNPNNPLPTIGTYDYTQNTQNNNTGSEPTPKLKHGLGGLLMYDQTGPSSRMMLYASYGIHIPIKNKTYLSLGLQAGFINYRLDFSDLDPLNILQIDNALQDGTINSLEPDLGAGLMIYSDKFYIGASSAQVLGSNLSYSDVQTNELVRHYFIQGGYRFNEVFNGVDLIPFALVKMLEASPASFDLGFRTFLGNKERLMLGLGYRGLRFSGGNDTGITSTFLEEDAAFLLLGLNIKELISINYSLDYTFSDLRKYTPNAPFSHEISIGLRLRRNKNYDNKQRLF